MRSMKRGGWFGVGLVLVVLVGGGSLSGCSTLDRAYKKQVTLASVPVVGVVTNAVVMPEVSEGGAVRVVTNMVPVFYTNMVQVPVTNLVARPGAVAAISAAGSVLDSFAPGIGTVVALLLGGLYHGYRQLRNRKVNEALVQGVETARAVLTMTPQGQAADAQFVKWLMDHQRAAGVFTAVSDLVEVVSDNPAAVVTAQEIARRVEAAGSRSEVRK